MASKSARRGLKRKLVFWLWIPLGIVVVGFLAGFLFSPVSRWLKP